MRSTFVASRIAGFCVARSWMVIGLISLTTAALSIPFLFSEPEGVASDEPTGPVFAARDAIDTRFDSGVAAYDFIVESPDGNVLDREELTRLTQRVESLRSDPDLVPILTIAGGDQPISRAGVVTIADLVEDALGNDAANADNGTWRQVASQVVDGCNATLMFSGHTLHAGSFSRARHSGVRFRKVCITIHKIQRHGSVADRRHARETRCCVATLSG